MLGDIDISEKDIRTLYLNEIDNSDENYTYVISKILALNEQDDIDNDTFKDNTRKDIQLIINSFGGDFYAATALVAAIESSITPIITVGFGAIMSASLYVFLAGHTRVSHSNSTFMYHQISSDIGGNIKERKIENTECIRLQKIYDNYITKKTKIKQNKLDKYKKENIDWYISGDEALNFGICEGLVNHNIK